MEPSSRASRGKAKAWLPAAHEGAVRPSESVSGAVTTSRAQACNRAMDNQSERCEIAANNGLRTRVERGTVVASAPPPAPCNMVF